MHLGSAGSNFKVWSDVSHNSILVSVDGNKSSSVNKKFLKNIFLIVQLFLIKIVKVFSMKQMTLTAQVFLSQMKRILKIGIFLIDLR